MLQNIHVKNMALIDEADVDFGDHLNILTGETGAGKSIIIGSISMALGGKVSRDVIRKDADYALVELNFKVKNPQILAELEKLNDYENYLSGLHRRLDEAETELKELSDRITAIRKANASVLQEKIKAALVDLNFLDVQFEIQCTPLGHYTENGQDSIEFMISTNPGETVKPLGKVASGGELSRIMLAVKSVLADADAIETLIFDEIDTGISGRTAQKVSEKMAVIARKHQVICITHLPQIAAMADDHYVIEKKTMEQRTMTEIHHLSDEASVDEIARLLGGVEITDAVMKNAREMKNLARSKK